MWNRVVREMITGPVMEWVVKEKTEGLLWSERAVEQTVEPVRGMTGGQLKLFGCQSWSDWKDL